MCIDIVRISPQGVVFDETEGKRNLRERSIRRATDRIKERFEGKSLRLKRITPGKFYSALTNRVYIGIRQINKRSKEGPEEVPAAWPSIVTERYHLRCPHQHIYLLLLSPYQVPRGRAGPYRRGAGTGAGAGLAA